MLYYQTISSDCKAILQQLTELQHLQQFRLVGGTSLALQLGHRTSLDLDFFTDKTFDEAGLERKLSENYPLFAKDRSTSTGFSAYIGDNKVDFYNWSIPFIRPIIYDGNIRICDAEEIAAMKLDAITRRQEKKKFYDLYELLKRYPLQTLIKTYKEKYLYNNDKIPLEVLQTPHVVDISPDPHLLISLNWEEVKQFLQQTTRDYLEALKSKREHILQQRLDNARRRLGDKTTPDA